MVTTRAAVARPGVDGFEITDVRLDELRPHEVLVQIVACGMCHTDLSAAKGVIPYPLPGILGHEGSGIVVEVGSAVTRVAVGAPVLLTFTSCGECAQCRDGHPALCRYHLPWNLLGGRRADGSSTASDANGELNAHFFGQSSFALSAIADERSVIPLPEGTTREELITFAPLGCGLQTGAGAIFNVLKPDYRTTLVVTGAGAVGLAAVMAAATTAAQRIIVADIVPERLQLARELGATDTINPMESDLRDALSALTDGDGVTAAIETTGNIGVLEALLDSLAVGGTCAVIGAPPAGARASFAVNMFLPGRRIVGVTLGDSEPLTFVPQLIRLHREGRFPIDRLQRRYAFDDINDAARDAANGTTIKPVLVMGAPE